MEHPCQVVVGDEQYAILVRTLLVWVVRNTEPLHRWPFDRDVSFHSLSSMIGRSNQPTRPRTDTAAIVWIRLALPHRPI
jgi:hypothetical protein